MIRIVDISQAQGAVDPTVMKSLGVQGIIMRVAHGMTADTTFAVNYPVCAETFGPNNVGVYPFLNPKRGGAQDTARFAITQARSAIDADPQFYMLDVENYKDQSPNVGQAPLVGKPWADYIRAHIDEVRTECPHTVVIGYTNRSYWNGALGPNDAQLASELDWIVPRYPVASPQGYLAHPLPPDSLGWEQWAFGIAPQGPLAPIGATWSGWQFSAGYNKQGAKYGAHSTDLDLNLIDEAAWARWTTVIPNQGSDMATMIFTVDTLPGEYMWSPGSDPIAFVSPADRDACRAGLSVGASQHLSKDQYDRLFTPPVQVTVPPIQIPPYPTGFSGNFS